MATPKSRPEELRCLAKLVVLAIASEVRGHPIPGRVTKALKPISKLATQVISDGEHALARIRQWQMVDALAEMYRSLDENSNVRWAPARDEMEAFLQPWRTEPGQEACIAMICGLDEKADRKLISELALDPADVSRGDADKNWKATGAVVRATQAVARRAKAGSPEAIFYSRRTKPKRNVVERYQDGQWLQCLDDADVAAFLNLLGITPSKSQPNPRRKKQRGRSTRTR
jgi:hypothetical protein